MLYLTHVPEPPLRDLVDYFWLVEGERETLRKGCIAPSGTVEFVVNLREDEICIDEPTQPERRKRFSGAVVSGTYSGAFLVAPTQHQSMFGVHFKPGGAYPLLGTLASELADRHVDAAELWGRSAIELRERLYEATTAAERFQVAENFLRDRLRQGIVRHPAVTAALTLFGPAGIGMSVRDVARQVGVSQRHIIQLFTAQVGLKPKLFCRLLRFQMARTFVDTRREFDWAQLAVECGYFDQSHLIRDFQIFSGFTPAGFLHHRGVERPLQRHVPLLLEV
jgi:AraC-like DNA-binding protein